MPPYQLRAYLVSMLRWICPECGHEWPDSETDCPACVPREARVAKSPEVIPAPSGTVRIIPGWMVSLVLAIVLIVGLGALVYLLLGVRRTHDAPGKADQGNRTMTGASIVVHSAPINPGIARWR